MRWRPVLQTLCAAVAAGAREALAGYPTTIEEDLAALRDPAGSGLGAPGSPEELAVRVRLGEKEALDATLAYFEGRAADLPALEYYQERRLKRLGLMDEDGLTTTTDSLRMASREAGGL
jgi:[ribulose-bisphosphate carboxylase]-lysine N-methyltransferase